MKNFFNTSNKYAQWFLIAVLINICIIFIYYLWHTFLVDKCWFGLCNLFLPTDGLPNFWLNILSFNNPIDFVKNIFITTGAILTALFTASRILVSQKQNENQENQILAFKKQILIQEQLRHDALFAKGIDYLNPNNDLSTQRGGIYILTSLATTQPEHTQRCLDILLSINQSWMPFFLENQTYKHILLNDKWRNSINLDTFLTSNGFDFYGNDKEKILKIISLSQSSTNAVEQILTLISKEDTFLKTPLTFSNTFCSSLKLGGLNFKNKVNFSNATLLYCDFTSSVLDSIDCRKSNFSYSIFTGTSLIETKFNESVLENANFNRSIMNKTVLKASILNRTKIQGATIIESDFEYASGSEVFLNSTFFENSSMFSLNFTECEVSGAIFKKTKIVGLQSKIQNSFIYINPGDSLNETSKISDLWLEIGKKNQMEHIWQEDHLNEILAKEHYEKYLKMPFGDG